MRARVVYSSGYKRRRRSENNASSVKMSNATTEGLLHRRRAERPY